MSVPQNATGSHDRVRLQRTFPNSITIHGTVVSFNPLTGDFTALMDYQAPDAAAIAFTRHDDKFVDDAGLEWKLVG
jgi:hypothetical protein